MVNQARTLEVFIWINWEIYVRTQRLFLRGEEEYEANWTSVSVVKQPNQEFQLVSPASQAFLVCLLTRKTLLGNCCNIASPCKILIVASSAPCFCFLLISFPRLAASPRLWRELLVSFDFESEGLINRDKSSILICTPKIFLCCVTQLAV